MSSGISKAVLISGLFPHFCGFFPSAIFFSWGIWTNEFSEEVCSFSSRNAANELSWWEPSDSAADMSTCEQSTGARNSERSYAFWEGFSKRTSLRNLTRWVLKIFTKRSLSLVPELYRSKIHTIEESWRKMMLREIVQDHMMWVMFVCVKIWRINTFEDFQESLRIDASNKSNF